MARVNCAKNRCWNTYRKFEKENKRRSLKRLSETDSFNILNQLHQFSLELSSKPRPKELNAAKIKTLARVHSMFGKVKS